MGKYMNCFFGRLNVGKVKLCSLNMYENTQFMDFIYGGCDMSTMVAIDCTIANGNPALSTSLHFLPGYGEDADVSDDKSA